MMNDRRKQAAGFTLAEVSVATAILVIAVGMSTTGLIYVLRASQMNDAQNEMDIQVQTAMERIKYDLRLSSLDEMFFYPEGAGPYTAISFPMARDDDGDGAVDLDGDGKIIWDRTMVYHVWSGEPNELRLTVFDPRDADLSDSERQQQINSVVGNGGGGLTHNGTNASTTVVFANLFDWTITPAGSIFDGYASEAERAMNVVLGSTLLDNGPHTFTFTAVGKNASSSNYRIGVDTLQVSPSYGEREGEAQWPVTAQSGATAVRQYKAGGSWSGNYHLYFPADGENDTFTLTMNNDRWEETNFRSLGDWYDDTTVEFDMTVSPYDYVVCLDSMGYDWWANDQTSDSNGVAVTGGSYAGGAIRVLVRGQEMMNGNFINHDGNRCWVYFRAGGSGAGTGLGIESAYIAECSDSENPSMDAEPGTTVQLYNMFGGGEAFTIASGNSAWSSLTSFSIDKEKSYLVTFLVDDDADMANPWKWNEVTAPTAVSGYMIPGTNAPSKTEAAAETWSARSDVATLHSVLGVCAIYTTYPQRGYYTSRIYDTQVDAPTYTTIDWDDSVPWGGAVYLRTRSGSSNDLSDAASWTNIAPRAAPGALSIGNGRYVQFQAEIQAGSMDYSTPKLKDVAINWEGPTRIVDIGGTFTRGPDFGVFELEVDGAPLKSGVNIELVIYKDVAGLGGMHTVTSMLRAEVSPRNSNR